MEAAEVLQTTTVQSLDEKEVQLQELRAKADSLISQLREKENELTQLKQKKLQLEEKGDSIDLYNVFKVLTLSSVRSVHLSVILKNDFVHIIM